MKHLKLFESFNKVDIHEICKEYGIKNYTINNDGSIDVKYVVNLIFMDLTKLPIKFNKVNGNFRCSNNQLTSLEGSPKIVNGYYFDCSNNNLKSLKGCPEIVDGTFYCHNNEISSFEHFPKHITGHFLCDKNPIWEIWKLFEDKSKIELFNDIDIIQDGVVILDRLNYFLEEIGEPTVKSIKRYKYI